jgi:sulfoxide reductase heme-binding subunit YedZ
VRQGFALPVYPVTRAKFERSVLKPIVFILSLAPAAYLVWALLLMLGVTTSGPDLGADPLKAITHETGDWTIRFICLTLAITPLRKFTKWNGAIKFRRMIGLFAFFYGTLHFLIYAVADRFASLVDFPQGIVSWDTAHRWLLAVWDDIAKRPYITIGFTALVLMLPLAITSTTGWIRRMGGKRWNTLHKLVYVTAVLAVIHYWWLVKADIRSPLMYAVIVAVLLGLRVIWAVDKSRTASGRAVAVSRVVQRAE